MEPTINHFYPVKVWLLTNAAGSVLYFGALCMGPNAAISMKVVIRLMPWAFYIFPFALAFSLPALVLFWMAFVRVRKLDIRVRDKKLILITGGLLLVALTSYTVNSLLFPYLEWTRWAIPASYGVPLAVFAAFIRMYRPQSERDFEPEPAE